MDYIYYPESGRGTADHGWLKAKFSFSFAEYHNPKIMHFGALRVLNNDIVHGGKGFGMHPHDNMEIITIPLKGALKHEDSMGNSATVSEGEIQVMSAGTGIMHSEFNPLDTEIELLQIWIFPNTRNVEPRYDQFDFQKIQQENSWQQLVSNNPNDLGSWIHQDAWITIGEFDANEKSEYKLRNANNGIYAFLISGSLDINGLKLEAKDALGVWNTNDINVSMKTKSKLLLLEVPLKW